MNHPTQIENYYQLYKTEKIECNGTDQYILYASQFKAPYHNIMKYWDKFQIVIYDTINEIPLYSYNRNYALIPPPVYVKQNDQEFIVTSGSYQCISIYNITTNEFRDYVYPDDEAFKNGDGFCPTSFGWLNDRLIIRGSLFNGPPQYMILYQPDLNNLSFENAILEDEL